MQEIRIASYFVSSLTMAAVAGSSSGSSGDAVSIEETKGLGDCASWMKGLERTLAELLLKLDQGHLFENWTEGADEEKKHSFFEHVRQKRDFDSASSQLGSIYQLRWLECR